MLNNLYPSSIKQERVLEKASYPQIPVRGVLVEGMEGDIPPPQAKVLNFADLSFGPRILSFSFKPSFKFWSKFQFKF